MGPETLEFEEVDQAETATNTVGQDAEKAATIEDILGKTILPNTLTDSFQTEIKADLSRIEAANAAKIIYELLTAIYGLAEKYIKDKRIDQSEADIVRSETRLFMQELTSLLYTKGTALYSSEINKKTES